MGKNAFTKPAFNKKALIALMRKNGLLIADDALAYHTLERIGYYRFSGYCLPFQTTTNRLNKHQFHVGTKLEDVLNLYEFDSTLRNLLMDGNSAVGALLARKDATTYMREQAGVRVTQPSWDLLASGYIKDLPSVRFEMPDGASPAEVTVPAHELLASGYIKDLPNVRYQTVVAKDTDSSTS